LFGAFLKFSFDISSKLLHNDLFKKKYIFPVRDRPTYIWVSLIYRYQPKRPILSASVSVDKMLLHSSRIQTIAHESTTNQVQIVILQQCTWCVFITKSGQDEPWSTHRPMQPKQKHYHQLD